MRIRKHASFTLLHQLLHASNAATPPTAPASSSLPPPPPPPAAGATPPTPAPRSHQPERQKQQKTSTELCLLNQSPWDALPLPSLLLLLAADDAVPPPPQVAAEDPPRDRAVASTAPADLANSTSSIPSVAAAASSGSGSLLKPSPPKRAAKALPEMARRKSDTYRGDKRKVTAAAKRLQVKEEVAETTDSAAEKNEADVVMVCKKSDGKGWNCKREAKRPNSFCDYHLSQIRSYYRGSQHHLHLHPHRQQQKPVVSPNANGFDKQKKVVGRPPRPPRSVKEDQDGPEFYYYSGFGPWRGKKRGAVANAGGGGGHGGGDSSYHPTPDNLTDEKPKEVMVEKVEEEYDNVGLDPESIDDVDDSSDDGTGASWINRRKGRKPVKARSLKSLM